MAGKYADRKIVLILGAGCTRSENTNKKPPLDKGFFRESLGTNKNEVNAIREHFKNHYHLDICDRNQGYDSLEYVMVRLYADSYEPSLGKTAYTHFLNLVKLFNKRLADTTNAIKPVRRSKLFRLIVHFLNEGADPANISIITFNQDIHIEKTLDSIESCAKYQKFKPLLNFPHCYKLPSADTSSPKGSTKTFAPGEPDSKGIEIMKLHGSLNWYSLHTSNRPQKGPLFNPDRKLHITTRKEIDSEMKYAGKHKKQHTFPVIIPPLSHKSEIFHPTIADLWTEASEKLENATDAVIFGYSCPEVDHASENLLRRTLHSRKLETFSIVDISSEVVARFADLTKQKRIYYYSSIDSYLNS